MVYFSTKPRILFTDHLQPGLTWRYVYVHNHAYVNEGLVILYSTNTGIQMRLVIDCAYSLMSTLFVCVEQLKRPIADHSQ